MSRLYYPSETDNPSSKFVKTNEKQKDKVRRIVNRKLRPSHFQIKTYYLSDAHYPMDNRLRRIIFLSREYGRFWTNKPSDFIRLNLKTVIRLKCENGQSSQQVYFFPSGGCGWVVVRFVAENPGVWPFHCHITWHFVMGMQVIFIESADKLPKPSSNIPACGGVTPQMFVDKMKSDETPKAGGEKDCKDDTTLLVILLIGWGLFVVSFVLVIALFCRLRQMLGFSLDKSNNVAMT